MAITKILFIRARLDDRVSYVTNEKKTTLGGMIEYAVSGDKTEQRLYEAALNCASPETAYREMTATKERWGKTGGVLGYHIIQSFSTGETTPDEAHEIGIELTRRLSVKSEDLKRFTQEVSSGIWRRQSTIRLI